LAVDFGFIKLPEAIAEISGLRHLRAHGGTARAHEEFYVIVWIVVGMNINAHYVDRLAEGSALAIEFPRSRHQFVLTCREEVAIGVF
jgi:hypothetical protein